MGPERSRGGRSPVCCRTYTGRSAEGRPLIFDSMQYADAYLARVSADIQAGRWVPPDAPRPAGPPQLAAYAAAWLQGRDLSESTRLLYAGLLDGSSCPRSEICR